MGHQFRFYLDPAAIEGLEVRFDPGESHHLSGVLRRGTGAEIEATNGLGELFAVRLTGKWGGQWHGEIVERTAAPEAELLPLALALPCLKGDRWELALEAACELGTGEVWLVDYRQAAVAWSPARADRARRKAVEALKQSGGTRLTRILGPCRPADLLQIFPGEQIYLADAEGQPLEGIQTPALLVVGPEAGWSGEEEALFRQAGAKRFSLGSRRLRSEIASIAALAALSMKLNT
ncbi:MAG: RsmE family RNA methyltransferase [Candidatus Zixiibacteriota bacterium]|nr:MAG: RsmE family RNA methyltransferase [candidate division Zixibacteria bacterium]